MNHNLLKWLNNDSQFESKYRTNNSISNIRTEISNYSKFRKYYNDDTINVNIDIDILLSDDLVDHNIEIYTEDMKTSKQIKIPEGTNHKHVNYLFKKLIDISEKMILDKKSRCSIFNKNMKNSFYDFCKKYS
jgi:hypothetical protein